MARARMLAHLPKPVCFMQKKTEQLFNAVQCPPNNHYSTADQVLSDCKGGRKRGRAEGVRNDRGEEKIRKGDSRTGDKNRSVKVQLRKKKKETRELF